MPTTPLGRADTVELIGDEDGFNLHIDTEQGSFVVNVHSVIDDLVSVAAALVDYKTDGEMARMSRPLRDDQDAYAPDDPKRADWHSVHADLYDSREGK